MRAVEAAYGKPIETVLRTLYYEEALSLEAMADVIGVPAGTLAGWMIRLGINRTAMADAKAKELAS